MPEQEFDLTDENVIKNPHLLNQWCEAFSELKHIDPHLMCAVAKDHFEGQIPIYLFTDLVSDNYKNTSQKNNALKRIKKPETKQDLILSINTQMKKQPKSKLKRLVSYLKNEWIETASSIAESQNNINSYANGGKN